MPRLLESVVKVDGDAQVELGAAKAADGSIAVSGSVAIDLELCCDRCLEPMRYEVRASILVRFVRAGSIARTSEHDEAEGDVIELAPDGLVNLHELVEDEVLLALPIAPKHETCGAAQTSEAPESLSANPFAVLAELKGKN